MRKLVINHLEKLFVTSDAATIVQELEVAHPAARMLVQAAKMQEQEVRSIRWRSTPAVDARVSRASWLDVSEYHPHRLAAARPSRRRLATAPTLSSPLPASYCSRPRAC